MFHSITRCKHWNRLENLNKKKTITFSSFLYRSLEKYSLFSIFLFTILMLLAWVKKISFQTLFNLDCKFNFNINQSGLLSSFLLFYFIDSDYSLSLCTSALRVQSHLTTSTYPFTTSIPDKLEIKSSWTSTHLPRPAQLSQKDTWRNVLNRDKEYNN